jgi:hypothetical protein
VTYQEWLDGGSAQERADDIGAELAELRAELDAIKADLLRRKAYNPNQPRVPAGSPDGGQWTTEGEPGTGANQPSDRIRVAQFGGTVTDADGSPYYQPGGHHEMPQGIYKKWNLRPETRKVFEQATTGGVPQMLLRTTPDGVPQGHLWNGPGGAHAIYNEAVQELSDRFLERNNIKPETMTPDQALALLKEIRESQDPRIRDYNAAIRLLRRLFRLRAGRATE